MAYRFTSRYCHLPAESLAMPMTAFTLPATRRRLLLLHQPCTSGGGPELRVLISPIGNEFNKLRVRHESRVHRKRLNVTGMGPFFIVEYKAVIRIAAQLDRTAGKTDFSLRPRRYATIRQLRRQLAAEGLQGIGECFTVHILMRQ